jgi:hypothetical protein
MVTQIPPGASGPQCFAAPELAVIRALAQRSPYRDFLLTRFDAVSGAMSRVQQVASSVRRIERLSRGREIEPGRREIRKDCRILLSCMEYIYFASDEFFEERAL